MPDKSLILLIITTIDSKKKAQEMAKNMVRQRLAACAQISEPIESHYLWNGEFESSKEWKITFKTSHKKVLELEDGIRLSHSYDTPEILRVPIDACEPRYEKWVLDNLI